MEPWKKSSSEGSSGPGGLLGGLGFRGFWGGLGFKQGLGELLGGSSRAEGAWGVLRRE